MGNRRSIQRNLVTFSKALTKDYVPNIILNWRIAEPGGEKRIGSI